MVYIPRMAVAQSTEKLERYPFLFYVLEEGPRTQAIVERVVEVLADQVAVGLGLDNSLVPEGIWNVGEKLALTCVQVGLSVNTASEKGSNMRGSHGLSLA